MDELVLNKLEVARLDKLVENRPLAAAAKTAGAYTITIADILNGIIRMDPEAARDFTLPLATLAVAGVSGAKVGDSIDFHVINLGTAGVDETITLVTATGATLIGFMDVENSATTHDAFSVGSSMFRLQFTNVTSGSEAYDLIRLA